MALVKFADRATFLTWHDQACADHAIPRPGRRASDQEPAPNAQWTTAYVKPFGLDTFPGIFCVVPNEDVATYTLTPATPREIADYRATVSPGESSHVVTQPPDEQAQPETVVVDGRTYTRVGGVYREQR